MVKFLNGVKFMIYNCNVDHKAWPVDKNELVTRQTLTLSANHLWVPGMYVTHCSLNNKRAQLRHGFLGGKTDYTLIG